MVDTGMWVSKINACNIPHHDFWHFHSSFPKKSTSSSIATTTTVWHWRRDWAIFTTLMCLRTQLRSGTHSSRGCFSFSISKLILCRPFPSPHRLRSADVKINLAVYTLIARFTGPTWGPSGSDRTQVGPMLAPWTLLSGYINCDSIRTLYQCW